MSLASSLEGQVALVTGGGEGIGRAVALLLSSRGARVVITGSKERALGEVVGEIANAGGKARHLAGDLGDPTVLDAAVAKAVDVFGALHLVVATASHAAGDGGHTLFRTAVAKMAQPGRLIDVTVDGQAAAKLTALEGELGLAARGITWRAVVPAAASEPEDVAELVAIACSS
jgi:NAD(P)-dependent dehydrogenase (short-subunit alcohol dehydrogenase family)